MNGITEFIDIIASRLPAFEWGECEYFFVGAELLLCGHKIDGKGIPIEPDGIYPVNGPAMLMKDDHRAAMRKVYLRNGAVGVIKYLEQYIEPAEMDQFRKQFLSAAR